MWHPDLFHKQNSVQCTAGLFRQFGGGTKRGGERGALGWVGGGGGGGGEVWTDVMLAPFPFEERWATLESGRLTEVQLALVSVKPKTSSVCSPEGSQDILVKDPLSLNCQATSNPSGKSNYIGTIFKSNPASLCAL